MWDFIILAQFQGSEMAPVLFQDFMDGYIRLRILSISGWV